LAGRSLAADGGLVREVDVWQLRGAWPLGSVVGELDSDNQQKGETSR
jgi:hypothetical protein